jgi:adenine-specific DNA-methyltransferase
MYAKNKSNVILKPQYVETTWNDAFSRYNSFVLRGDYDEDNCDKWEVITVNEAIKRHNISKFNKKELNKFLIDNANNIFRTARNRSADYSNYPNDVFTKFIKDKTEPSNYHFIYKGEDVNFAEDKIRIIEGKRKPSTILGDIWTDIGINNLSNEGSVSLRFGKKPEALIERIIAMTTNSSDIILDYHLGSGTTAAVAHKMNRTYIGIEQLNYGENDSIKRLKNVINNESSGISKKYNWQGGGSFVYAELMQYNQYFIDKIQEAKSKEDILKVWEEMQEEAFISYQFNKDIFNKNLDAFKTASLETMQHYLIEILDKNQLYVNFSEIEDERFNISDEDKALNYSFYKK